MDNNSINAILLFKKSFAFFPEMVLPAFSNGLFFPVENYFNTHLYVLVYNENHQDTLNYKHFLCVLPDEIATNSYRNITESICKDTSLEVIKWLAQLYKHKSVNRIDIYDVSIKTINKNYILSPIDTVFRLRKTIDI